MPTLFDPIRLGAVQAPNRIVMAPLTRGRATRDHLPTPLMAEYYAQRAGAGLIITEATGISRQGLGWPYAPGIWSTGQVEAWKPVVQAVHAAGGRIYCQLWHMGRLVHPDYLGGEVPVSASATQAPDSLHAHTYEGTKPYARARPLSEQEIQGILADYRRAATNARAAGFDGVQLHAANGYLVDQFLRDGTNQRGDGYGGTVPNRLRFLVEATQAIIAAIGADRTSVRLSPNDDPQGCADSDPAALFTAAAEALDALGIAFLEMRASRPGSTFRAGKYDLAPAMRQRFRAPLILNSDYRRVDAGEALACNAADAIAFGRPFISNPDLPERLRRDLPLAEPDAKTYYTQGREGYVDYPAAVAAMPPV
jgi:N-ethylmaleimide reductase